jgi:hypothetical protein
MNTNKWKQSGTVYLWRYEENPKNYRGWHLTADSEGVRSLLELIDLMLKSNDEASRTIKTDIPTENELKVPNCKKKAISTTKIVLLNKKDNSDYWSISEAPGVVTLEAGDKALGQLKDGLIDIQNNKGDYFIGENGHELWFWWYIGG